MNDRMPKLESMLQRSPDDPRVHFGLAAEYEKLGDWGAAVRHLKAYLDSAEDQGNAWGRLGAALRRLGEDQAARSAYARGVEAARAHGHPSMAAEFEEILEEWDA